VRLFYATFLSTDTMRLYEDLVSRLRQEVAGAVRPIPSGTHHLTHAFLGEIPHDEVADCVTLLSECETIPAFTFGLGSPRVLMGRGRPRLICVDVTHASDQVSKIQTMLVARLTSRFPTLDLRPKPPHVTLARFHKRARRFDARKVETILSGDFDKASQRDDRFESVCLVRSSLTPAGPVYETLAEATLASSE